MGTSLPFFKTYTEKVWGIPCEEISAEWAAQRIKGFSLGQAIGNAITNSFSRGSTSSTKIKTLIGSFLYPRLGPGQMWEHVADDVVKGGSTLLMGTQPTSITKTKDGRYTVEVQDGKNKVSVFEAEHIISSIPLSELAIMLSDDNSVTRAAKSLRYRDFVTVALFLEGADLFSDNWIYIHDPKVRVGRIRYRSWSPTWCPTVVPTASGWNISATG